MVFPVQASPSPKLETKDLKAIFEARITVGSALRLLKAASSPSDFETISKWISDAGLSETYVIQDIKIEGTMVGLPSENLMLDLSGLAQGLVNYGGFSFSRKAFKSEAERFKGLAQFIANKNKSYTGLERLLLPQAHAEKNWSDWLKEKGLKTTAFILGVTSFSAVFAGMLVVFESTTLIGSALAASVLAVGVVTLALAIESLVKAGRRVSEGSEIICRSGKLYLKDGGKEYPLDTGSAGIAERKFREILCGSGPSLAKFTQLLKEKVNSPAAVAPSKVPSVR